MALPSKFGKKLYDQQRPDEIEAGVDRDHAQQEILRRSGNLLARLKKEGTDKERTRLPASPRNLGRENSYKNEALLVIGRCWGVSRLED